jgi:hypothetical protein
MAIYETLYPQGNFLDIRANAPTSTDYNIQVMEDLVRNFPGGGIRDLLAPATAATLSLPYDAIQAATRTTEDDISKAMETAGMYGPKDIASEAYGLAFGRERPLSSAIERTIGASGPLAERINNLNLFNSAVAAEKPTVPNLSLGYNMPTFNLGTGITNTTAATNMYSPFMDNQEAANQDLVQQIIAENAAKFPQGIMTAAVPQQSFQDFYGSVYEPYDPEKDDYQIRQIQGAEKKGIAKLMEVLGNIPTPLNLLRKAFEGVGPGFIGPKGSRAYGDESLFSTFGRSRTGAEFFQNVRDRKARQEAAARGAAKQADQARIDAFRAIRDSQPSGGGGGGGGGIGSSYGGAASPGSKGPGGSDEMGSF